MAISSHSKFYGHFVARNQFRLIDFCDDCVELLKKDVSFLNSQMLKALHYHSMAIIDDSAGEFRNVDVHISYSKYEPPAHNEVPKLIFDCLALIRKHWEEEETAALSIMAYALWRINWIHPFEDGNGRTSRALTYIINSAKFDTKKLKNTLPYLIEKNDVEYQRLLRKTDETFNGKDAIDEEHLGELAVFLFAMQLKDNLEN